VVEEELDQVLKPSQVWAAVADHSTVLALGCSSAGKAVLVGVEAFDQVVAELAVVDLEAAQVLGLAVLVLVAGRVVPVTAVAVHRKSCQAV